MSKGRIPSTAILLPQGAARLAPGGEANVASMSAPAKNPFGQSKANSNMPGFGFDAPSPSRTSPVQAHEAHRCALEGIRLVTQGRAARGANLLRRSIALNPGVASSHHDLGIALLAAGRLEQAVEAFAEALRLDPRLVTAHDYLGYIFDSQGQFDKAMASYQAAVALKPDLVDVQMRLGAYHLAGGSRVEASAAFRAAASAAAGTVAARIRRGARPRR